MKVQKLVYFAHGWYLAFTGHPLINEPVEAWRFGPVIPSLYHALKPYGSQEVDEPVAELDPTVKDPYIWSLREASIDEGPDPAENNLAKQIVKRVWEVYGNFSAVQLSNLTHVEDDPWSKTPNKDKPPTIIDQGDNKAIKLS